MESVVRAGAFGQDGEVSMIPPEVFSPARLAQVARTGLLDTEPEEAFDRFARLATVTLGDVTAFVTIVDGHRSFWKSCVTASGAALGVRQNRVEESFCQYLIASGEPLIVADARIHPTTRDNPSVTTMGVVAWAGYPLHTPDGAVLGTFCVVGEHPREWTETEVLILETLAHAVDGEVALRIAVNDAHAASRLAECEAQRAEEFAAVLRESLLPVVLPEIPGVDIAARHRPAGHGVDVLGDFYDVFPVPGGWGVVIGDVCGKGAQAAKTTALARSTVRTLGHQGRDPEQVLAVLDEVLADWTADLALVTATYCTVAPGPTGEVRLSLCRAGHPPALLRRADGSVERFGERGTVLGCGLPLTLRATQHAMRPGESLVLYTDGVTEARPTGSTSGLGEDRLVGLVAALPARSGAEELADAIAAEVDRVSGGSLRDDAAVLVLGDPVLGEPVLGEPVRA